MVVVAREADSSGGPSRVLPVSLLAVAVPIRLAMAASRHDWETLMRCAWQLALNRMTVTLKDFYADWCGPCKTQDPILEELEDDWDGRFEVEKVNVDEQQDVANEYQVRSLPTLIIENDDGIVERFVGVTQREDLEDALESAGA